MIDRLGSLPLAGIALIVAGAAFAEAAAAQPDIGISLGTSKYDIDFERGRGADVEDSRSMGLHLYEQLGGPWEAGAHYVHHGVFTIQNGGKVNSTEVQTASITAAYRWRWFQASIGPSVWTVKATRNGHPERDTDNSMRIGVGARYRWDTASIRVGWTRHTDIDVLVGEPGLRRFYVQLVFGS